MPITQAAHLEIGHPQLLRGTWLHYRRQGQPHRVQLGMAHFDISHFGLVRHEPETHCLLRGTWREINHAEGN